MTIKNLPQKYQPLWKACAPYFKQCRPGDAKHAQETVKLVLNYQGRLKIDQEVLVPVAMMHDIGHAALLVDHFRYITGAEKIKNGKLAHMLTGAKIATDLLKKTNYNLQKTKEIIEIISGHDWDQLDVAEARKKI